MKIQYIIFVATLVAAWLAAFLNGVADGTLTIRPTYLAVFAGCSSLMFFLAWAFKHVPGGRLAQAFQHKQVHS